MIEFHYVHTPNARKIRVMLAETGFAFRRVDYDVRAGDHLDPGFRKLNPNNKLPVIRDLAPEASSEPVQVLGPGRPRRHGRLPVLAEVGQRDDLVASQAVPDVLIRALNQLSRRVVERLVERLRENWPGVMGRLELGRLEVWCETGGDQLLASLPGGQPFEPGLLPETAPGCTVLDPLP